MNDTDAEDVVATFLHRFALRCVRPTKQERRIGKTPDFRVFDGDVFKFFGEVKSVRGDDALRRPLANSRSGSVMVERPDPAFNRLTADVHDAVKQFNAVNRDRSRPNVLAFVNLEDMSDFGDVLAVVTGDFFASDGTRQAIYRTYSHGRMRADQRSIDMILWLDAELADPHRLHIEADAAHHATLCAGFGSDPSTIKAI